MTVAINWIPVEERLPDVNVHEHEDITYVTYEDLVSGKRYVTDDIMFDWCGLGFKWVEFDEDDYDAIYGSDWHPFEDERFRVVAWSKDTVDILPY